MKIDKHNKGNYDNYKSHRFFIQFPACSDHDRFVKFNRRGVLISDRGRANSSEINTWGRLLETLEY